MSLKLVIELQHPTVGVITSLVAALSRADELMMPANAPPVTALRYSKEPDGVENWQPTDVLLARGKGDCEDLAAYHAAWLRVHGVGAQPVAYMSGPRTMHVVVLRADGVVDDPSRWCGMR